MAMDDDRDHPSHYLKKSDTHLAGETESKDWLKSVPHVYGLDRQIKDLHQGATSRKRPRNGNKPRTAPEAA
jgi:hypothetical protein